MIITFGKCKGQDIKSIPDDYCMWLAKAKNKPPDLTAGEFNRGE